MNLEIRQAGKDDVQSILNCLAAAFAPYSAQYTRDAFADTVLDVWRLQERMQEMHILVALSDGKTVGTVSGAVRDGGEGHLRGMAVLPQCAGTGIAAQLLNVIETWPARLHPSDPRYHPSASDGNEVLSEAWISAFRSSPRFLWDAFGGTG
jgi:N-acetylglutamate synthase-like GNAT family acetyltransferase